MHGSGVCRRPELSLYTEFRVSAFMDSPFGFPFTLGSPGYAGLLLFFLFVCFYQKDDLSVEFLKCLCGLHDSTAPGQSCAWCCWALCWGSGSGLRMPRGEKVTKELACGDPPPPVFVSGVSIKLDSARRRPVLPGKWRLPLVPRSPRRSRIRR